MRVSFRAALALLALTPALFGAAVADGPEWELRSDGTISAPKRWDLSSAECEARLTKLMEKDALRFIESKGEIAMSMERLTWAVLEIGDKVDAIKIIECAIAGPGEGLARLSIRDRGDGHALGTLEMGTITLFE